MERLFGWFRMASYRFRGFWSDCNDPSQKCLRGPFSMRDGIKRRYQVVARAAVVHVTTTTAGLSYGYNPNNESSCYIHTHTVIVPGQGALSYRPYCSRPFSSIGLLVDCTRTSVKLEACLKINSCWLGRAMAAAQSVTLA